MQITSFFSKYFNGDVPDFMLQLSQHDNKQYHVFIYLHVYNYTPFLTLKLNVPYMVYTNSIFRDYCNFRKVKKFHK